MYMNRAISLYFDTVDITREAFCFVRTGRHINDEEVCVYSSNSEVRFYLNELNPIKLDARFICQ